MNHLVILHESSARKPWLRHRHPGRSRATAVNAGACRPAFRADNAKAPSPTDRTCTWGAHASPPPYVAWTPKTPSLVLRRGGNGHGKPG